MQTAPTDSPLTCTLATLTAAVQSETPGNTPLDAFFSLFTALAASGSIIDDKRPGNGRHIAEKEENDDPGIPVLCALPAPVWLPQPVRPFALNLPKQSASGGSDGISPCAGTEPGVKTPQHSEAPDVSAALAASASWQEVLRFDISQPVSTVEGDARPSARTDARSLPESDAIIAVAAPALQAKNPLAFAVRIEEAPRDQVREVASQEDSAETAPKTFAKTGVRVALETETNPPTARDSRLDARAVNEFVSAVPKVPGMRENHGANSRNSTVTPTTSPFETEVRKETTATVRRTARPEPVETADSATSKVDGPAAFVNGASVSSDSSGKAVEPGGSLTEGKPIRAAEPVAVAHSTTHVAPAKEISMRLVADKSDTKVDVKVVERGGSVHVAVRTPDAAMAENLQSGLTDLVHRLEHKGFEAEAWSPADRTNHDILPKVPRNGDDTQDAARDPRNGSQHGNHEQHAGSRKRPQWVAELEQSLEGKKG